MDNLTHTLFALTLARTPLGRAGRGSTAALLVASNLPDIDVVTAAGGTGSYLTWHRGPTHGLLGVVGLGLITAVGVSAWLRITKDKSPRAPDAPFFMLAAVSMIGVFLHILLDLPTSYGTRLLSPFDWHWFAVDWMPIVDVYLLAVLAAGLVFGLSSPTARRRNAAIVLVLMTANYGVRAVAHQQALLNAPRVFGPLLPPPCNPADLPSQRILDSWPRDLPATPQVEGKRCLVEIIAVPTFLSPLTWRVIAHLSNAYEIHDLDLLDARFRRPRDASEVMWRTTLRYPNDWTPPVFAAATTPLGRTFLGFSRLAAARAFVDPAGTATVRWTDMRFVATLASLDQPVRRTDPFTLRVRLGPDGQVLEQTLGR